MESELGCFFLPLITLPSKIIPGSPQEIYGDTCVHTHRFPMVSLQLWPFNILCIMKTGEF